LAYDTRQAFWPENNESRKKQENNLAATEVEHPAIVEPPI
jgi:hypothetical protein